LQHQSLVRAVAFSPDGRTVLTGSDDNTARLWSVATGKALGPPLQHQGEVVAVAFNPDGLTVLTGSVDKTARVWEVPTAMKADAERIKVWTQVSTGTVLDRQGGVGFLSAEAWNQRRRRLEELGGPPKLWPSDPVTKERRAAWRKAAIEADLLKPKETAPK
jgi:hypothetical protein